MPSSTTSEQAWPAPTAGSGGVHGTVTIPGSKSLTNRALVLAALAAHPTVIKGALVARDTRLMVAGLRALGAEIAVDDAAFTVHPHPLTGPARVDCGLAGTVMRFLPPVAALAHGDVAFDGDPRARERPMAPLLAGLEQLGVRVTGTRLPLVISGQGRVAGATATIDASGSSQFVSGLLLAAARFDRGLTLRHRGPALPSLPHIAMTVDLLAERGVAVTADTTDPTDCQWQVAAGPISGGTVTIEPDLSNAGPFLAAAMLTGSTVVIADWPSSTTQAGDYWRDFLASLGAQVALTEEGLQVHGPGAFDGFDVNLRAVGELTPTIAALAACARTPSRLTGIGHLRGHETDRLTAIAEELCRIGVEVEVFEDGLAIDPRARCTAADVVMETYADHRMATMAAILALRVRGLRVADAETTSKTMPDFVSRWEEMLR